MTNSPTADPAETSTDDVDLDDADLEFDQVDPATLKIGENVRFDPKLDADMIDNIRRRGVKTAISAYRDEAGDLVVLRGQQRALIAAHVGRKRVAVVIEPEPSAQDRITDQLGENDRRTALKPIHHVAAWEQLAAIGLSAGEIAKRTSTPRPRVEAGLAVAASPVVRKVAEMYPDGDLLHTAVLVEFADDDEARKRLENCIAQGVGFDHWVRHFRDQRAEAAVKAEGERVAREEGLTVLDEHPGYSQAHARIREISYLKHGKRNLSEKMHAKCPGRAFTVAASWVSVAGSKEREYVWRRTEWCTNFKLHGHALQSWAPAGEKSDQTDEEKAKASAERKRTIKYNALWRSATTLRREFLGQLITRKKAPDGTGKIMAAALTRDHDMITYTQQRGSKFAHVLFGVEAPNYGFADKLRDIADGCSDARGEVIALGMVLASYEDNTDNGSAWKCVSGSTQRYLLFLQECGYELSDVERIAAGLTTVDDVEAADAKAGVPA